MKQRKKKTFFLTTMDMKLLSAYESPFHFIVHVTSVLLFYIRHYKAPL